MIDLQGSLEMQQQLFSVEPAEVLCKGRSYLNFYLSTKTPLVEGSSDEITTWHRSRTNVSEDI